jgi:hypothetical protein
LWPSWWSPSRSEWCLKKGPSGGGGGDLHVGQGWQVWHQVKCIKCHIIVAVMEEASQVGGRGVSAAMRASRHSYNCGRHWLAAC